MGKIKSNKSAQENSLYSGPHQGPPEPKEMSGMWKTAAISGAISGPAGAIIGAGVHASKGKRRDDEWKSSTAIGAAAGIAANGLFKVVRNARAK